MRASAEAPDVMAPGRCRVVARRRESPETVTIQLQGDVDSISRPGQFNMVYVFGVGEIPISISGVRKDGFLHTTRAVGKISRAVCEARKGDVLGVRGPFGTDWGLDEAEGADIVIVGGGIGFAPLRPAVESILARRSRYGSVSVVVGARSPSLLLFKKDVARWRSRFDLDLLVTVDVADASWRGHVGVVSDLIPRLHFDPTDTVALVCGPEVMMRVVAAALLERGLGADHVRVSMERNMRCGVGHCGHCQFGPYLLCRDGPVLRYGEVAPLMDVREL